MAVNDEELSITVQRYPVLFDKSNKEFHRKDVKRNAWKAVAQELDLEDGDEAEKLFQRLRDRYTRAKKALQEQNKSGTSAKAVKRAREKLNSLQYMQWLDEYAKPRKSKSNLVSESDCENDNTIENKENNSLQLAMSSDENDSDDDSVHEKEKDKPNTPKQLVKNPKNVKKQDKRKVSEINDTVKEEMDLLRSVVAAAQEPQKEDDFDLFGRYVASKMRKLSKSLTDGAMETVEFNITSLLNQAKIQNVTPEPSYHQIEQPVQGNHISYMHQESLKNRLPCMNMLNS